jgi:uncharacterized integral membrane protein
MDKKKIIALLLVGLGVVVLLMTRDTTTVNLVVTKVSGSSSFVLLGAAAYGVLIGVLLR